MNLTEPLTNKSILFVVTETSMVDTAGKWLIFASLLHKGGKDISLLLWSDDAENGAKELGLPFTRAHTTTLEVNRAKEVERLTPLLDWNISGPDSPLWADLLILDDFLGTSQGYKIDGVGSLQPKLIILPYAGSENGSPTDEQMRLILRRWATQNHIQVLGIQLQSLGAPYAIHQAPVDHFIAISKESILPPHKTSRFYPIYRYLCGHGKDTIREEYILQESALLANLNPLPQESPPRFLFTPLHLYYLKEHIEMLQALKKCRTTLLERGYHLLFSCGGAHRRGLTEKDIIVQGMARWLQDLIPYEIVENGTPLHLGLLSDAILLPYPHSVERTFSQWGIPVITQDFCKEIEKLPYYTRPNPLIESLLPYKETPQC